MEENKLKTVEQPRDRVVLVGLSSPVLKADSADEESMDELAALVETAGAVSVATVLQNKKIHNFFAFFINYPCFFKAGMLN